jgi:hypothetical protein
LRSWLASLSRYDHEIIADYLNTQIKSVHDFGPFLYFSRFGNLLGNPHPEVTFTVSCTPMLFKFGAISTTHGTILSTHPRISLKYSAAIIRAKISRHDPISFTACQGDALITSMNVGSSNGSLCIISSFGVKVPPQSRQVRFVDQP